MSVYSVKGKGWRADFIHKGTRYTEAWFPTKKEAMKAIQLRKEAILNPQAPQTEAVKTETDMEFLELVNIRLDYLQTHKSERYYQEYVFKAREWVKLWGSLMCSEITDRHIEKFITLRKKVSPFTANKEIRYLRALFNYGIKKKRISNNPIAVIDFIPEEKRLRYVPPAEDIEKVISIAAQDTQDYLIALRDSMARMGEINRLVWDDVDFRNRHIILYTRKKKGGHLQPRKIPMTNRLHDVLWQRFLRSDQDKPWVFWHTCTSSKTREKKTGPYNNRSKIMKTLCKKAGVKYFRFHALRHSGASILDNSNVPLGSIQKLLGHENRSTTEIYLHSIGQAERDAINALEKALS